MKKNYFKVFIPLLSLSLLTSCYNTRIGIGECRADQAKIKVNSKTNHFFLWGLVSGGGTKIEGSNYVDNSENYIIRTNVTFLNGLVDVLTFGIYTPMTTTFYLPVNSKTFNEDYSNSNFSKNSKKVQNESFYSKKENDGNDGNPQGRNSAVMSFGSNENDFPEKTAKEYSNSMNRYNNSTPAKPTNKTEYVNKVSSYPQYDNDTKNTHGYQSHNMTDTYKATIYFKNGAKMDGIITDNPANRYLEIELPGGQKIQRQRVQIERIERV